MTARRYGPAYAPLLALSGLFLACAIVTLIPNPGASWPNILGYRSVCTFAPGATLGCALLAAATCVIRARLVRKARGPIFVPVLVIGVLAAGVAASTMAWAGVKAEYGQDSLSGASAGG